MPDFRIALTADFYDAQNALRFADMGLELLAANPRVATTRFAEHRPEIAPEQLRGIAGAIVLTPRVSRTSVAEAADLLAVARFGVGFDGVDVTACTLHDVAVTITTGAVDRPVAEATVGWMIGLTHHLRVKDRLVREGAWDARTQYMGRELRDRTLGLVGFGGIGRALVALLHGFGMRPPLVHDPFVADDAIRAAGCEPVALETLLARADFVSLHCPLNERTRGLIGAREIARMRPDAYLINTARGGIVDEDALFDALRTGAIAGAALDCFAAEPVVTPHRFGTLDNVLLAPHAIAWTEEMFRDVGRAACGGLLALSIGRRPTGVLNPEVFLRPTFRDKWARVAGLPADRLEP